MTAVGDAYEAFYAITPPDMHSCQARHSMTGGTVHFALTDALTTYCDAIRGPEVSGEVNCVKCLVKWASSTAEGRDALIEALAGFRRQQR